jgi:hypothetical protein
MPTKQVCCTHVQDHHSHLYGMVFLHTSATGQLAALHQLTCHNLRCDRGWKVPTSFDLQECCCAWTCMCRGAKHQRVSLQPKMVHQFLMFP